MSIDTSIDSSSSREDHPTEAQLTGVCRAAWTCIFLLPVLALAAINKFVLIRPPIRSWSPPILVRSHGKLPGADSQLTGRRYADNRGLAVTTCRLGFTRSG